jgi:2-keto-4-pentenoate hydratase/2-oxohepta-3-ene-1,7-dioic acid hydratase in catechol pathway
MRLLRIGEPGAERPAILDGEGTARDLRAGDVTALEIDGLGQAEQRFVAAP